MRKLLPIAAIMLIASTQGWGVSPEEIFEKRLEESPGQRKGIIVRKGTIKALIDNVILLNKDLVTPSTELEQKNDLIQTIEDIKEAIHLVEEIFMFDVFSVMDWFDSPKRPGNILVGVFYLKANPEKITQELKNQMRDILMQDIHPLLRTEINSII